MNTFDYSCICTHGGGALGGFQHCVGCPMYVAPQPQQSFIVHGGTAYPAPWPSPTVWRLHPDDIEAIARRVVEELRSKIL